LASEEAFRTVQALQRSSHIVPVVGDLGGEFALQAIGNELRQRNAMLGAIYISNVEQYLFEAGTYRRWVNNLRSLPIHPEAILIRSYPESETGEAVPGTPTTLIGQIRRSVALAARVYLHPNRKPVHRMPTVTHRLAIFLQREKEANYRSFRELIADAELAER
jgi:hypothetical protein